MTITLPDELVNEFDDLELTFQRIGNHMLLTLSDSHGNLFDARGRTADEAAKKFAANAALWLAEYLGEETP